MSDFDEKQIELRDRLMEQPAYALPDRVRRDQQFLNGKAMIRVGKKAAGRTLDGVIHDARLVIR